MASLFLTQSFHSKTSLFQHMKPISSCPRILTLLCCQSQKSTQTSNQEAKKEEENYKQFLFTEILVSVEKFGKNLKENMRPQQKGDWKDVVLMSLSFAVYVYMSQRIVCAYCAWMSLPRQPW